MFRQRFLSFAVSCLHGLGVSRCTDPTGDRPMSQGGLDVSLSGLGRSFFVSAMIIGYVDAVIWQIH